MLKYLALLLFALPCFGQNPSYDYATPFAMTTFTPNGSGGGSYGVTGTSNTGIPFVDYAQPFFPVCYNPATSKYYGCGNSAGGSAGATAPAMPQSASLLAAYPLTEGSGTTAYDYSGRGNNGTISGAAWEGKQDLNFPNAGNYIALPSAVNAAQSWLFLAYFPVDGNQIAPLAPGYGDTFNIPSALVVLCGTTSTHLCLAASLYTRGHTFQAQAFNTDQTAANDYLPPGWGTLIITCGVTGTPARLYFNGSEVSSYAVQGTNTCPLPASGNYQLGGSASPFAATWFVGKMAGAWAWNSILSPADALAASNAAFQFLASKGVSRTFRPIVQPAPQIVAALDSRTSGYLLTPYTAWPALMTLTDSTYLRTNVANAGELALDACTMYDLTYASKAGPGSGPVITVIWGGVNDIRGTNQTMAQIANDLRCVVQKAKAQGSRVILSTEISCAGNRASGSPTCDVAKDQLDAVLRSQAFGWGVDNLADLATDALLGADGAYANTTYFSDGTHPNSAGELRITAVMQDAVNELLGSTETAHSVTAATAYTEVAGDRWLDLTGSAAQAVTLLTCTGKSLPRYINNFGSVAGTVGAQSGQTYTGSTVLAPGASASFLPVPGAAAVGGCSWERTR